MSAESALATRGPLPVTLAPTTQASEFPVPRRSRPNRGSFYDHFTGPGGDHERRRAYAVLLRVSRFVDKACIGIPRFNRITPVVRQMIRNRQVDF